MAERELITAAFGNYGNLVAAQYINGTSRYDVEHNVLYFETRRGARMPRLVMLDHQHPSRIVGELDINKVTYVEDGNEDGEQQQQQKKSGGGYSDPYDSYAFFSSQQADETDIAYADRMYLNDETLDESAFYGGAAIGNRVREQRRKERQEAKRLQKAAQNGGGGGMNDQLVAKAEEEQKRAKKEVDGEADSGSDEEDPDTIPLFNVKDPLVPWYRYIIPPLHRTSYQLMRSSHSDPRGTALLHSFGHGMAAAQSASAAPAELLATWDSLRYQLEASDRCQGFQLFVDADGALGGYAHATIRHVHDEYDDAVPIATHALFTPFNIDMVEDDFAKVRAQEVVLNHALSTHYLSTDSSSIYVPYRISDWARLWGPGGCAYADDNVATAQMVAAAVDTGFYNTRDPENRLEGPTAGGDGYGHGLKPLSAYADALKPAPSYRICSAYAALPFGVRPRGLKNTPPSFSELLEDHPLMAVSESAAAAASASSTTFRPLSHGNAKAANTGAGRVHGQTFTLRGVGQLVDRDMPRLEALTRLYLYPTQCSRVIATVTDTGYAISGTFSPSVLGFPAEADLSALPHTPMAAHYCATSNATAMIKALVAEAAPIIKYSVNSAASPLRDSYGLERDEWAEVLESLEQLRDDYDEEGNDDDEDYDDDY